jgi:alpha-tubulin suppressor-like RCC1 family protein
VEVPFHLATTMFILNFLNFTQNGQLGDGTKSTRSTPVPISFNENKNISRVAVRIDHTLFVKQGRLYSFGFNDVATLFLIF